MAPTRTQRTTAFRNRILDLWPTNSAGEIAAKVGTTRNVVLSVVRTARAAGDKRAVNKPEGTFPRPAGWWREGCPTVQEIARRGGLAGRGEAKRRYGL